MIRVSGKSYTCRAVYRVDDYDKVCASNDVETDRFMLDKTNLQGRQSPLCKWIL